MASKRFWNSYIQVWTLKTQCTKVIPFSLQLRFSQLLFPEACDRCELHALILRNQESLRGNHVNNGSCLKVEVGRFNTGKPQGFTVKCGCNIFISLASSYLHTLHILLDEKKKKNTTQKVHYKYWWQLSSANSTMQQELSMFLSHIHALRKVKMANNQPQHVACAQESCTVLLRLSQTVLHQSNPG